MSLKLLPNYISILLVVLSMYSCSQDSSLVEAAGEEIIEDPIAVDDDCMVTVSTAAELMDAVNNGNEGDVICILPGTYEITTSLLPKNNMVLKGTERDTTIITGASSWNLGTAGLPDRDTDHTTVNSSAYLINLANDITGVSISKLTLTGPQLHGAIYGNNSDGLEVYNTKIEDFLWSGIRTFRLDDGAIYDTIFIDAGGNYQGGTGGGIFVTFTSNSDFYDNVFMASGNTERKFYGIKGRNARNCHIYQNTINVNFSIEFPFDNDSDMEIDHNYMVGTVSIPKSGGGGIPDSGVTYRIHHNYFASSYAMEWSRNGVEIDHNLFDFSVNSDAGNLITSFGDETSVGPTVFHDNLIKNPGRGIFWARGVYNNYSFYNNHVITNTTITPRTEGLFGFNTASDFCTIKIKDNIIECIGTLRPLVRNTESFLAVISNNELINVSDADNYKNDVTGAPRGPIDAIEFNCGAKLVYSVDGFNISK